MNSIDSIISVDSVDFCDALIINVDLFLRKILMVLWILLLENAKVTTNFTTYILQTNMIIDVISRFSKHKNECHKS